MACRWGWNMTEEKARDLKKYPLYYPLVMGALLVHVICQALFLYWNEPVMKFYNLFSIAVFAAGLRYIRRYQKRVVFVVLVEATIFVMLATITMGWDYGFQNWMFAFLIVELTVPFKERKPFYVLGVLQSVLYIALSFAIKQKMQWEVLFHLDTMFIFLNMAAVFAVIFFSERVLGLSKAIEFFFLQKEMDEMRESISRDELTGLVSRRRMNQILADMNDRLQRESMKFYLIFGDIDHFKNINDAYGHEFGDCALKQVSNILNRELRGDDIVARWGGEEFLILLRSKANGKGPLTAADVKEILNRVRRKVEEAPLCRQGENIAITITFGGVGSDNYRDVYEMIRRADEQMYNGKKAGRNRVQIEE